jgi:hypothetical protein
MRKRFPASIGAAVALLALLAAVLLALAATVAVSAPDKHVPHAHRLSPRGQDVETFQLAGNPRGDAAAVWVEFAGRDTAMWLRSRRHGQSFGKPERLASGDVAGISPVVAVGDDGTEVAAWVELRGEHGRVFVATRGPDGSLDRRRMLGGGVEPDAGLAAAVAPDGTALVAWSRRRHREPRQLRAAIRRPHADWSHPHTLTSGKWSVVNPSAAFDAAGNATLVWERRNVDSPGQDGLFLPAQSEVSALVRPAGGPFGRPRVVSRHSQDASFPRLAENARGDAIATWDSVGIKDFRFRVGYATRRAGEDFGPARWLTGRKGFAGFAIPTIDSDGRTKAAWTHEHTRHGFICDECAVVRVARGQPGGPLSNRRRVSGRRAHLDALAANPGGDALLVWDIEYTSSEIRDTVEARFMRPGGGLSSRRTLTGTAVHSEPQALLPANRDGIVAWLAATRHGTSRIVFVHVHG